MKKTSEVETEDAKLEHNIREEKLCVEVKKNPNICRLVLSLPKK